MQIDDIKTSKIGSGSFFYFQIVLCCTTHLTLFMLESIGSNEYTRAWQTDSKFLIHPRYVYAYSNQFFRLVIKC